MWKVVRRGKRVNGPPQQRFSTWRQECGKSWWSTRTSIIVIQARGEDYLESPSQEHLCIITSKPSYWRSPCNLYLHPCQQTQSMAGILMTSPDSTKQSSYLWRNPGKEQSEKRYSTWYGRKSNECGIIAVAACRFQALCQQRRY